MKNIRILFFLLLAQCTFAAPPAKVNNPGKGFVVIELFTSEGCSSCPPADALVARVQQELNGQAAYILAFHVDYWDRLGWKDAFSNPGYSERQQQYATWLHLSSVYTPQIVVNGQQEFVGSEEATLRAAIKTNLDGNPSAQVSLHDLKVEQGQVHLQYEAVTATKNTSILLAVVQKSAQTQVKRGENQGRTLSHVQVVRELKSVPLNGQTNGAASITLPAGVSSEGLEVVAFLQNTSNGRIIAATKTDL